MAGPSHITADREPAELAERPEKRTKYTDAALVLIGLIAIAGTIVLASYAAPPYDYLLYTVGLVVLLAIILRLIFGTRRGEEATLDAGSTPPR